MSAYRSSQWNKIRSIDNYLAYIVHSEAFKSEVGKEFKLVCLDRNPMNLTELTGLNYAIAWRMGADARVQTKNNFSVFIMTMTRKDNMNESLLRAEDYILENLFPGCSVSVFNYSTGSQGSICNSMVLKEIKDLHGIQELAWGFKFKENQFIFTMPI